MLLSPDRKHRHIKSEKYLDIDSKDPLDLNRFRTYIHTIDDQIPKNWFLINLMKYEENAYSYMKQGMGDLKKDTHFSEQDTALITELLDQIQGRTTSDKLPQWQKTRNHILEHALHVTPAQLKYFSDLGEKFEGKLAISLVRMIAELEITGELPELAVFNGEDSFELHERFAVPNTIESTTPKVLPELDTHTKYTTHENDDARYLVDRNKIGEGGMAVVYRAWDTKLQKLVCVKKMRSIYGADPKTLVAIELEAKTLARLHHVGIPAVYDFIEHDGDRYIVMEFLQGDTLEDRLHIRPYRKSELLSIVDQAADIIDYLADDQESGGALYHHDIKPSNFMISPEGGNVSLIDFGIASWVDKTGSIIGTPRYMSPERIELATIDRRSDVYSLAATTYALLTNDSPFSDDESLVEIMREVASGDHKVLSSTNRPLFEIGPIGLEKLSRVINTGMQLKPEDRYGTAREFAEAFKNALLTKG